MKTKILLLSALVLFNSCFLFSPVQAQISASDNFSGLEGKTCTIKIVNKVKTNEKMIDKLIFSINEFKSELCESKDMHIISKNIYSVNGIKNFSIEFKCENNKKVVWDGEIKNNMINGTLIFRDGNKSPVEYLFSGVILE